MMLYLVPEISVVRVFNIKRLHKNILNTVAITYRLVLNKLNINYRGLTLQLIASA